MDIDSSGSGTFSDCTFTSNTADGGGAVYNDGAFSATDCFFSGNTAPDGGNDVYNNGGTVTCPSSCPDGMNGTCVVNDCYECTCYSCDCIGLPTAVPTPAPSPLRSSSRPASAAASLARLERKSEAQSILETVLDEDPVDGLAALSLGRLLSGESAESDQVLRLQP